MQAVPESADGESHYLGEQKNQNRTYGRKTQISMKRNMELTEKGLQNQEEWKKAGYALPEFNREEVKKNTKENPRWIHFGAGNIFRAFQANVVQNLLNKGALDTGLIVAEGYDYEIIEKMNRPHDDYSILVTLKADGRVEKTVVGSIMESLTMDPKNETQFQRLKEIFCKDSLQMVSFTITEKGYSLVNGAGVLLDGVAKDFEGGPAQADSYIGKLAALLYERYLHGKKPIALVSMDNCSHNGDKLYDAVSAFAKEWTKRGLAEAGFLEYVENPQSVSFPWSMIDKITPRPAPEIQNQLKEDGITDLDQAVTSKNTYVAPFVNAEECQYLVIEDAFPNGRPELEKGGVIFTQKETVDKVEKMKVCTCLNPLHTALAIFGCLLSYETIHEEMEDADIRGLAEKIGYQEGLPVVVDPKIIKPKEFIDEVIMVRLPNPFMTDTPQRIATDTSQKLAIRFGETVKAYQASKELEVNDLKYIPLVYAGWCRYLMGIDDNKKEFSLSPDPLLDTVRPYVKEVMLGAEYSSEKIHEMLSPILSNSQIFGINLYETGLGEKTENYFKELIQGEHAVRNTLNKYVS